MKEKLSLTRRTNDQNILTSFFCTEVTSGAGEKVCVCVLEFIRGRKTRRLRSRMLQEKENAQKKFIFSPEQLDCT